MGLLDQLLTARKLRLSRSKIEALLEELERERFELIETIKAGGARPTEEP